MIKTINCLFSITVSPGNNGRSMEAGLRKYKMQVGCGFYQVITSNASSNSTRNTRWTYYLVDKQFMDSGFKNSK